MRMYSVSPPSTLIWLTFFGYSSTPVPNNASGAPSNNTRVIHLGDLWGISQNDQRSLRRSCWTCAWIWWRHRRWSIKIFMPPSGQIGKRQIPGPFGISASWGLSRRFTCWLGVLVVRATFLRLSTFWWLVSPCWEWTTMIFSSTAPGHLRPLTSFPTSFFFATVAWSMAKHLEHLWVPQKIMGNVWKVKRCGNWKSSSNPRGLMDPGWPFQLIHMKPADSPWIRQRLPLVWPSHAPRCWPHCANEFQPGLEHKLRKLKVSGYVWLAVSSFICLFFLFVYFPCLRSFFSHCPFVKWFFHPQGYPK